MIRKSRLYEIRKEGEKNKNTKHHSTQFSKTNPIRRRWEESRREESRFHKRGWESFARNPKFTSSERKFLCYSKKIISTEKISRNNNNTVTYEGMWLHLCSPKLETNTLSRIIMDSPLKTKLLHCKLYILLHNSQSLALSPSHRCCLKSKDYANAFRAPPHHHAFAISRQRGICLNRNIFLTSVRQSWTELPCGDQGTQLNRNNIGRLRTPGRRATFFFSLMSNNWISAEQVLLYHEDVRWKVAASEIQLVCSLGKCHISPVKLWFLHSIAEYWALHSFGLSRSYGLTCYFLIFFYSTVGYMSIGITLYKKKTPDKTCCKQTATKKLSFLFLYIYIYFSFSFCTVDNKINLFSRRLDLLHDNVCKHRSNQNI